MTQPKGPLLTLETLEPDRPFLTIDGTPYELAVMSDFGLVEQARLARLMAQAASIDADASAITDDDEDALRDQELLIRRAVDMLDEAVAMILPAPAGIRAKLAESQKIAIVEAFVPLVQGMVAPQAASKTHPPRRSTSAGSSRSSRRRTATVPG